MTKNIRLNDFKLVNVLRTELQEFVPTPMSDENLTGAVHVLINYMRNNARTSTRIITIDAENYWDNQDEAFYHKNKAIFFTLLEKKILSILLKNLNHSISYNSIAIELWGGIDDGSYARIKTLVKQVRKKLPKKMIKNIFSYGYKIEVS